MPQRTRGTRGLGAQRDSPLGEGDLWNKQKAGSLLWVKGSVSESEWRCGHGVGRRWEGWHVKRNRLSALGTASPKGLRPVRRHGGVPVRSWGLDRLLGILGPWSKAS